MFIVQTVMMNTILEVQKGLLYKEYTLVPFIPVHYEDHISEVEQFQKLRYYYMQNMISR